MKNQKGFIQIPLLIVIIMSFLVIGGVGYLGIKQYKNYQAGKEKQTRALTKAQQEIEILKQKQTEQENKPSEIIVRETTKEITISSSDIEPYLTGVGQIECSGDERKSGSTSLWSFGGQIGYAALTNYHIISGNGNCNLTIGDSTTDSKHSGMYRLDKTQLYSWNSDTDISALKIIPLAGMEDYSTTISNLNYSISSLRKCPTRMELGSPVVIVGFPAFSQKSIMVDGYLAGQSSRTVTNGIISAHDTSLEKPIGNLPSSNYYISAKIDSGNSGGMAFSKDSNGLCVLGIPTWLTVGNYETQGIVQNIHNIMYTK